MTVKQSMSLLYGIVAALLLLCLLHMPYGFYVLVRIIATLAFCFFAYVAKLYRRGWRMIIFFVLAIIFQPIIKFPLGRGIWNILDVCVAAYLLFLILFASRDYAPQSSSTSVQKRNNPRSFMLVLGLLVCFHGNAQNISGERRVYYLDVTYSMVSNKLLAPCKENLIKAIENIEDINTEIVVVAFADDRNPAKRVWKKWESRATTAGKDELIKNIRGLEPPVKTTMTNLYDPWVDFYSETKPGKVNYMFLMTDGGHEQGGDFFAAIDQWKNRTNSLTYGFFVELTDNVGPGEVRSRDKARQHIDQQKERLWRVSTADVNINLIRLENSAIFNVRGDKYIDVPIYFSGKDKTVTKGLQFDFNDGSGFRVQKVDISDACARIYVDCSADIHTYPSESSIPLTVRLNGVDDKTFLLTQTVCLNCLNKKERVLFLSDNLITGKVKHYDSFAWVKANTTPCSTVIDLEFNQDALSDPDTFVEFAVVDNNGAELSTSKIIFSQDGVPCPGNVVKVKPTDKSICFSVSFPEGTKSGVHQGYLKPVKYHLDRIGNVELSSSCTEYPITWRVRYIHPMNPLKLGLAWLLGLLLAAFFIWMLFLKPIFYPRFGSIQKTFNVPGMAPLIVKFKGARMVVVAASHQKKQSGWNRFWTGKILYKTHPAFVSPITFKPSRGRRVLARVQAGTYQVMPNPMPGVGAATIIDIKKNLKINVN